MPFFNLPSSSGEGGALPVLTGQGSPSDGVGADGQLYIDALNGRLFVKEAGTWGSGISVGIDEWSELNGKPTEFPPASHGHVVADVDGLQALIDGKAAAQHGHAIADVDGLGTALDGKADAIHTHEIAAVNGLQTALDNLASGGVAWSSVPASPTSAGAAGSIAYNATHFYVAVAANTWRRVGLSTWTAETPTITITQQPTNQTAADGAATFTVAATASNGSAVSYQWELSTDSGATWANVTGATAASLALTGLTETDNGNQYRAVVSATNATSVPSDAATLTVGDPLPTDAVLTEAGDFLQTEAGDFLLNDGVDAPPPPAEPESRWVRLSADIAGAQTGNSNFGSRIDIDADGTTLCALSPFYTEQINGQWINVGRISIYEWQYNSWSEQQWAISGGVDFATNKRYVMWGVNNVNISNLGTIVAASGERFSVNPSNLEDIDTSTREGWVQLYTASGKRGSELILQTISSPPVAMDSSSFWLVASETGASPPRTKIYEYTSDWQLRTTLLGPPDEQSFGRVVAVSKNGDRVAVASNSATRIYGRDGDAHFLIATIENNSDQVYSPTRLAFSDNDGSTLVIAHAFEPVDGLASVGAVRVYSEQIAGFGNYQQRGATLTGEADVDRFGESIAISADGTTLAIGKPKNFQNNAFGSGTVSIYKFVEGAWELQHTENAQAPGDAFGASAAMSEDGTTVAIGAPQLIVPAGGYVRALRNQPRHLDVETTNFGGLREIWATGSDSVTLMAPAGNNSYQWQRRTFDEFSQTLSGWNDISNQTARTFALEVTQPAPYYANRQYRCILNGTQPQDAMRLYSFSASDPVLAAASSVIPSYVNAAGTVMQCDATNFLNYRTRIKSISWQTQYRLSGQTSWVDNSVIAQAISYPTSDAFLLIELNGPSVSGMAEWRVKLKAEVYASADPTDFGAAGVNYDLTLDPTVYEFYSESVQVS